MHDPSAFVSYPDWLADVADWRRPYLADEEKMRLAIDLARENHLRLSGGPFGAAIFDDISGELIAVGLNSAVRLNNSILHAETMALMMACARLQRYSLRQTSGHSYVLASSCEPCAMCLGATMWSRVNRLITGARREDARRLGFMIGPTFSSGNQACRAISPDYNLEIFRDVLRAEARTVMANFQIRKGHSVSWVDG